MLPPAYFFFLPFPLPFLSDLAVLGLSSFLPWGLFFLDQAWRASGCVYLRERISEIEGEGANSPGGSFFLDQAWRARIRVSERAHVYARVAE